jgi:hypothetical protein
MPSDPMTYESRAQRERLQSVRTVGLVAERHPFLP